jgi:hypothetical protein
MSKQRITVAEAAEALAISPEAVRMRIERGQLDCEKQRDRVFVWLDSEQMAEPIADQTDHQPRAPRFEMRRRREDFQEELTAERQAHAQTRRLLMLALQPIPPQPKAPQEPPSEP